MLTSLCIKNFATVEQVELDFSAGLTSITGETGAGKSVLLDGLALTLGSRSTKELLRDTGQAAEITATFEFDPDLEGAGPVLPKALVSWLNERELLEAPGGILFLRRILKPDGRSKAFINNTPVTLADLKFLGEQLVDLHSQHEYQSLLKRSTQHQLLDNFANNQKLCDEVKALAMQWQSISHQIEQLQNSGSEQEAKRQLLNYQVQELEKLALQENEIPVLEQEQKTLAAADSLLADLHQALSLLGNPDSDGEDSSIDNCARAAKLLAATSEILPGLRNGSELLESATIQLREAAAEIEQQMDQVVIDPQRLNDVESRLDALYTVARKHHCKPEELLTLQQSLQQELDTLEGGEERLQELEAEKEKIARSFTEIAGNLSKKRQSAARKLTKNISDKLAQLNMAHCQFEIKFAGTNDEVSVNGNEYAEFLISTIPDKPPAPLARIASGGELSRISLAIQVVTAQTTNTPLLVFDEVDVGIGGATAEVVGNLLRELGEHCQVLCVTHQAQVAARGHQQLLVSKQLSKTSATTDFKVLDRETRTRELARMMGGKELTESTLAHAAEILESA